jgi:hypothetical protein
MSSTATTGNFRAVSATGVWVVLAGEIHGMIELSMTYPISLRFAPARILPIRSVRLSAGSRVVLLWHPGHNLVGAFEVMGFSGAAGGD